MTTDIAELGVRYRAEGQETVKAANRDIATTGKVAEAQIKGIGTAQERMAQQAVASSARASVAMNSLSGSATRAARSFDFRGPMMQLSQVAQQTTASGDLLRAFAIQAPDLGLYFGTIGIAAGVAVGALLPLVQGFFETSFGAQDVSESVDSLNEAMSEYTRASRAASASTDALERDYGNLSGQARQVLEVQRELAEFEAIRAQQAVIQSIASEYGNLAGAIDLSNEELRFQLESYALYDDSLRGARQARSDFDDLSKAITDVTDELGLSAEQAAPFIFAMQRAASATNEIDRANALGKAREEIMNAARNGAELSEEMVTILRLLSEAELAALALGSADVSSNFTAGADSAARMAGELERAVDAAINLSAQGVNDLRRSEIELQYKDDPIGRAGALAAEKFGDVSGFDPIVSGEMTRQKSEYIENAKAIEANKQALIDWRKEQAKSSRSSTEGGGGGGVASVDKTRAAYDRLLGTLDPLIEAENKYAAAKDVVNDALRAGTISTDEARVALALLGVEYQDWLEKAEQEVNGGALDGLNDGIESLIDNLLSAAQASESVGAALRDFLLDAALKAAAGDLADAISDIFSIVGGGGSVFGSVVDWLFNANGNVFSGGSVQAFANGGVVSATTAFPMTGGVGVMGEAGPEAIMPLQRGSDGKLGVQSNGGGGGSFSHTIQFLENGNLQAVIRNEAGAVVAAAEQPFIRKAVSQTDRAMRQTNTFGQGL